ncbi:MAG TPA: MobF family relaxase [Baekduia sp.]|uniref:MobF family relaxase n=1 Tax=Baekduia sp. TaxID=2600305 RepID=UPI002BD066EF|nr:MobF family relaxase [Baekduia sp.]HMJ36775.1 MobF family relaxase [Baekduia sp.]
MLSIGKVGGGAGDPRYYIDNVARGKEDYYSGRGESPGGWLGSGAAAAGVHGTVDDEQFLALLSSETANPRKVLAYDLTFSAPKSVSVLFGVGDRTLAPVVREAHDPAVEEALGYVERHATWTRRGSGGHRVLRGEGLKVAAFRHRSSRAGDPQLHTHAVIANATMAEGRATTLDGRALYAHARTAGYLYEAALRRRLTEALGVEWEPAKKGIAEIRGIDERVLEHFSQRRAEIVERLAETGGRSRRAAEIAALDTRRAKRHDVDGPSLREQWRTRASALHFGPEAINAFLDHHRPRPARQPDLAATGDELTAPGGLTEQASTFDRRDVLRAWAVAHRDGAEVQRLEQLTDRWLASDCAVRLEDDGGRAHLGGARYSTPEMLALEQRLIANAAERRRAGVARVEPAAATAALDTRPDLSGEQAAMAARLTTTGQGVEVVRAAAGTGKTHALAAARELWEANDVRVFGTALSARAALELENLAGIDSATIASVLRDIDQGHGLASGSVLIVDEAGMVCSRTIDRLARHAAETEAKLVLVGDDRQLPEIDAGGAFRGLAEHLGAIELHQVRRPHADWDRDALAELRDGDVRAWADAYRDHGRIVARPTARELRAALVDDWWEAARTGEQDAVMIAHRRSDVAELNALAHARMHRDGQLGEEELAAGDRSFSVGDRVIARRNDRRVGVVNGTRGEVVRIDREQRTLTVRTARDAELRLEGSYLDEGWLEHGYALTAHAAQGATVDRSFVLGSDELYREWGYAALSRHRDQARFYVVSPGSVERALPGLEAEPDDLHQDVVATLSPSRTKDMALDVLVRGGVARTVVALDEVAMTEQRIADMQAEHDGLSRLRRSRRAAIERDIHQQRAAIERWSTLADEVTPTVPLRLPDPDVATPSTLDRHAARTAMLDPSNRVSDILGDRPTSFAAREAWMREAALLVTRDTPLDHVSSMEPSMDDLGLEL